MSAEFGLHQILHAVREKRNFERVIQESPYHADRTSLEFRTILHNALSELDALTREFFPKIQSELTDALQVEELTVFQLEQLMTAFHFVIRNALSHRILNKQLEFLKLSSKEELRQILVGLMIDFSFKQSLLIARKSYLMHPLTLVALLNTYPLIPHGIVMLAISRYHNPDIPLGHIMDAFRNIRTAGRYKTLTDEKIIAIISQFPNDFEHRLDNEGMPRKKKTFKGRKIIWRLRQEWDELNTQQQVIRAIARNYLSEEEVALVISILETNSLPPQIKRLIRRVSLAVIRLC